MHTTLRRTPTSAGNSTESSSTALLFAQQSMVRYSLGPPQHKRRGTPRCSYLCRCASSSLRRRAYMFPPFVPVPPRPESHFSTLKPVFFKTCDEDSIRVLRSTQLYHDEGGISAPPSLCIGCSVRQKERRAFEPRNDTLLASRQQRW